MEIKAVENINEKDVDILVVGMFEGETSSDEIANEYAIAQDGFKGKFGHTYLLQTYGKIAAKKVLLVGFGKREKFDENKLREVCAKAVKKANSIKAKKVAFDLKLDFDWANAAALGAMIGNYCFDKYKSEKAPKVQEFYFPQGSNFETGVKLGKALDFARDLANEPAAYATPTKLAEIAKSIGGIETKVYEKEEVEKMGMNAFLAVAKGSVQPPKFIHMKYTCENPKKKIAIIGKGLCFDSGGLDLKPPSSMLDMKDDMSAAASTLAIMQALKDFAPNVEVHGIIAACENMPSGSSFKPGDIVTAKNGKTIEVDNTDAEGRLTLADALCYASELGVDEVIDMATLTGACVVALGSIASGIMGNDDDFIERVRKVAEESGERCWKLPMYEEYMDNFKSDVADMKNTGARWGGASGAGVFLQNFVKDVKWVHIDVAGTAFIDKPYKEFTKGATGAGVRAMLKYIMAQ